MEISGEHLLVFDDLHHGRPSSRDVQLASRCLQRDESSYVDLGEIDLLLRERRGDLLRRRTADEAVITWRR